MRRKKMESLPLFAESVYEGMKMKTAIETLNTAAEKASQIAVEMP